MADKLKFALALALLAAGVVGFICCPSSRSCCVCSLFWLE
jgi:hypothetical protein